MQEEIELVNMSFGANYMQNDEELRHTICEARKQGIFFVAPVSKNGIVTYPANYQGVISVGLRDRLDLHDNEIRVNTVQSSLIDVFACGTQYLYKNSEVKCKTPNEPSFASAVVTSQVYKLLHQHQKRKFEDKASILSHLSK